MIKGFNSIPPLPNDLLSVHRFSPEMSRFSKMVLTGLIIPFQNWARDSTGAAPTFIPQITLTLKGVDGDILINEIPASEFVIGDNTDPRLTEMKRFPEIYGYVDWMASFVTVVEVPPQMIGRPIYFLATFEN